MTQYRSDANYGFYTHVETGEAFATQKGIHQLIGGVYKFWEIKNLKASVEKGAKMAEVPTAGGLQGSVLYNEEVIAAVVQYYAFKGKKTAQESVNNFLKGGVVGFVHNRTGHQMAHPQVAKHFNWLDLREDAILVNSTIMAQGKNSAFDALNLAYFGMRCSDHKAARFLQEAHRYENLPDYVDVNELEQLIHLRGRFIRAYGNFSERINRAVSDTKVAFAR